MNALAAGQADVRKLRRLVSAVLLLKSYLSTKDLQLREERLLPVCLRRAALFRYLVLRFTWQDICRFLFVNLVSPIGRCWPLFLGSAANLLLKAEYQSVGLQMPVDETGSRRLLSPRCQCFSRLLAMC